MKFGCTDRTRQLRDDLVSKASYKGEYEDGIFVDISRAILYMDSYKQTEDSEPIIRRAKALYGGAFKRYVRKTKTRPPRNPSNLPGFCKHISEGIEYLRKENVVRR